MEYSKQPTQPDFFNSDDSKLYYSATSGFSPSNEWYEFDDRADAIDFISENFKSQSFTNQFQIVANEIYDSGELFALLSHQFGDNHEFSEVIDDADLSTLEPPDIADMVAAASRF